ncbi:alpha/beta hydrolase [candidate division KSB1 bacterium]
MSTNKDIEKFRHLIEPFTFEGGDECFFLIHGYTGTPSEMKPLGEFLADKGYTVTCPLLPGHGTSRYDLAERKWTEWYEFTENEWLKLREKYNKVYVAGLSLGGTLALNIAVNYNVDAVITMASGTRLGDWRLPLLPYLKKLLKHVKKTRNSYARGPGRKRFAYEYNPTSSTEELLNFYKHLEQNLSKVKSPLLLIHSEDDIIMPYSNTLIFMSNVSSEKKELITLEKAGHIITLSDDQDKIHTGILKFITELVPGDNK